MASRHSVAVRRQLVTERMSELQDKISKHLGIKPDGTVTKRIRDRNLARVVEMEKFCDFLEAVDDKLKSQSSPVQSRPKAKTKSTRPKVKTEDKK